MALSDLFEPTDKLVEHLRKEILPGVTDPFLRSRYAGFIAVVAVTVYERAIKEIFSRFAAKKHRVFGTFTDNHFSRLNGRISYNDLRTNSVRPFGDKYERRFKRKMEERNHRELKESRRNIIASYGNVVVWRNSFAHEGVMPPTATVEEVVDSYTLGKELIQCLAESMVR